MAEWFDALDDGMKAHVSAQNWHTLDANQAVAAAARAHATALTATPTLPPNAIVVPTDAADAAGWAKVHTALGVPADPKEYKFEGVTDEAQAEQFRSLAAKLRLPASTAAQMATEMAAAQASQASESLAKKAADRNEQLAALRQSWAGNYDHNSMIAERTRQTLGITPEAFEAMALTVGFDKIQNQLVQVGVRLGEAPFHAGGGSGGPVPTQSPREQLDAMMADKTWRDKHYAGDQEARAQFDRVTRAIVAQKFAR